MTLGRLGRRSRFPDEKLSLPSSASTRALSPWVCQPPAPHHRVSLGPRRKVWGQRTRMVLGSVPFACLSSQPPRSVPGDPRRAAASGVWQEPGTWWCEGSLTRGGHRGGPHHCHSVSWGLPRPLPHGMLINQAANRRLGGTAPLRRPQDTAGSSAAPGRHGAAGASADLGGGEPGLLPAPRLQQAPVSARQPSSCSLSSLLLLHPHPHPSPLTPRPQLPVLDPEPVDRGCHPRGVFRAGGGRAVPGSTTFICSSFWRLRDGDCDPAV